MSFALLKNELCERVGYQFADSDLLEIALTHASTDGKEKISYERLEFLGDRVLGLVISDLLIRTYDDENEGELSRRLSGLVDKKCLYSIASKIGLEKFVSVGKGTEVNQSILADVMEALFGAVFCDGGFKAASFVIEGLFIPILGENKEPPTDPKTKLQEWAQAHKLGLPEYREIKRSGPDHQPLFTISVLLKGFEARAGEGNSKRIAEQAAANALLDVLRKNSFD